MRGRATFATPRESFPFSPATYPNILFHFLPVNSTSVDVLNSSSLSHRLRHSNLTTASATRIDDLIDEWPRAFSRVQSLFTGLLVSYSLAQARDGVIYITTLFLLPNHCRKGCIFLTTESTSQVHRREVSPLPFPAHRPHMARPLLTPEQQRITAVEGIVPTLQNIVARPALVPA